MYWFRRGWAELRNEVLVLPSRSLVLAWVVALLARPEGLFGVAFEEER